MNKLDWDTRYGSRDLQALGLPSTAAARLAQSGWLKRLGRGVYQVPNAKLDMNKALAYLSLEVPELHVGGKTALAWRETRHNLAHQERMNLWGLKAGRLPAWFTDLLNATYQSTRIFDNTLPRVRACATPGREPESDGFRTGESIAGTLQRHTGKLQSLEETLNIAESVRHLRPEVLETLLSDSLELPWLEIAKKHNGRLGSSSPWVAVTRGKKILHLKI